MTHAERALELWPRVPDAELHAGMDHARLLASAGRMASAANQPERAMGHLQGALAELMEGTDVAEGAGGIGLLIELGMAAWEAESFDLSRSGGRQAGAFELGSSGPPSRLKADVMMFLGCGQMVERANCERRRPSSKEAMAIATEIGENTAAWAEAAAILAHTSSDMGQGVRASDLIDRSLEAVPDEGRWLRSGQQSDRPQRHRSNVRSIRRLGATGGGRARPGHPVWVGSAAWTLLSRLPRRCHVRARPIRRRCSPSDDSSGRRTASAIRAT